MLSPFNRLHVFPLCDCLIWKRLSWSPSFLQQQKCHPVSKLLRLLHVFSSNPSRPADSLKLPCVSRYTLGTSQILSGSEKMLLFFSQINHHTTVTVISQSPPLPSWSFQHCPQPFKSPPHQEDRGEGTVREFGMGTYTLLFLKWTTNKDPLYSTGNSAQCHVAAWMWGGGGGARCILPGGECTHVYETITTLLTGYTPVQNQKLKKKNLPTIHIS